MAVIRQYSAQLQESGIPQSRSVQPTDFYDPSGASALSKAGDVAGEAVTKIDERNQQLSAEKAFSDTYLQAQTEILKLRDTATGDEDLTGQTLAIYDKYSKNAKENFQGDFGKSYLERKLLDNRGNVATSSLQFESQLKAQKRVLDYDQTVDNARNIVLGDPTQFRAQTANLESTLDLLPINGVAKQQAAEKMREGMAQSYIARLAENNPALAKRELATPLINSMVSPEVKLSILNGIDSKQKAEAVIQIRQDAEDINTASKFGLVVPPEKIRDVAKAAAGANQKALAETLTRYADNQGFAIDFAGKPLTEQQAILTVERKNAENNIADIGKYEAIANVYENKTKLLKTDPWQYYGARGVVTLPGQSIIGQAPDAIAATIAQRRVEAEKVNQLEQGAVKMPLLTGGEIDQLKKIYETGKPEEVTSALTGIGQNLTGDERKTLTRQVAEKEPMLAVAMSLPGDTATKLLTGDKAKGEVSAEKVRELAAAKLSGVTLDPALNETLHQSIYAYYKQAALEKGDTGKEAQGDIVDTAIKNVMGDIVEISPRGVVSKVIAPQGMSANNIEDKLNALTDAQLIKMNGALPLTSDGNPSTANDMLRFGKFRSAGDGVLSVEYPGLGTLFDNKGNPYLIDIRKIEGLNHNYGLRPENSLSGTR